MELAKAANPPLVFTLLGIPPRLMRILVPLIALLAMSGSAAAEAPLIAGIASAAPLAPASDSVAS
jgi:hypothetical protein